LFTDKEPYALQDDTTTPLFSYELSRDISYDDLPLILRGTVTENGMGGSGDIEFDSDACYKVEKVMDLDNGLDSNFDLPDYYEVYVKKGNEYYSGSGLVDVSEEDDYLVIEKIRDFDGEIYLFTIDEDCASGSMNSISGIVNGIKNENICARYSNNEYEYYWNIPELLKENQ